MPDAPRSDRTPQTQTQKTRTDETRGSMSPARRTQPENDAFPCDRCGTAMFRMHAVWRCPSCGYKTDCCGW